MVVYGGALVTWVDLLAGLNASRGTSGDVGASMAAGVGSKAILKGVSGSSATGMGSTSFDPMFGASASGRAQFSALRPSSVARLLVGSSSHS